MTVEEDRLVAILTLRSFGEAHVLEAFLTEEEIPFLTKPFNDPAFGSFWRGSSGWGELFSYPEFAEEIREICEGVRSRGEPL